MTRTTQGVIATQWATFFWSALGILIMLTLAFRSLVLALLAIMPTMLSVALVLGLDGLAVDQARHGHGTRGERGPGLSVDDTFHCLIQFHRELKERGFTPEPLRQLQGLRARGDPLQPGRGGRFHGLARQRVRPIRQFRDHGRHRHGGQHAGQSRAPAGLPDSGASVGNKRSQSDRGCGDASLKPGSC